MLNLGTFVRQHARHAPDRTAVRMGETTLSYARLDAMSDAVAAWLAERGIGRGDTVALSCPNLPYFPVVYLGILKAGAVVAPLNVLLKSREIAYHLRDCEAKAYAVFEGTDQLPMGAMGKAAFDEVDGCEQLIAITADPAAPSPLEDATTLGRVLQTDARGFVPAATDPDDTAVILYTSGTTGQPKGAELSHLNMAMNAVISAELVDSPKVPRSERVVLTVLPLFHSFGQTVCMNGTFYAGGAITLLPRFDAGQSLQVMLGHGVTVFAGVPTMYWALLNAAKEMSSDQLERIRDRMTHAASGGSALPLEILRRFEEVYGIGIIEGYGLSETSPVATFNHADRVRKPGTVGQPVFGVEVRVIDVDGNDLPPGDSGEVLIRGHNIMKGYYNRPDATAAVLKEDGWFHSGDIGVLDDDGYLSIVDRLKDMIIRGGFNVYPREVEEVLMTHPDVSLAAVVGIPHEQHGEEIKAFVVPKEGAAIDPEEVVQWAKEEMAAYKYPRVVEVREGLPMNATGKILRRELRGG